MSDFGQARARITEMAGIVLAMWQTMFQAFMEHDQDKVAAALEYEREINELEKEITAQLVDLGRSSSTQLDKETAVLLANVVQDLELIGDYTKDILERVEIKIAERLLFSEPAVEEYTQLYNRAEAALHEVVLALKRDMFDQVKRVLRQEEHIDSLVDEYRRNHNQRLLEGSCSPLAGNMYLNILDFTAAVYYHTKKIVKSLLLLK